MNVTAVNYARSHWETQYHYSPSEYSRMAKRYRHNFRQLLPRDKSASILDVGSAGGFFLYFLHSEGFTGARGIDPDPRAIDSATAMSLPVEQADAFDYLDAKRECFDCIVINQVLEHFPCETSLLLLRLIKGALRPGGKIIASVPNGLTAFAGHMMFGDLSHDHLYTPKSLHDSLQSAGLCNITVHPEDPAPYDALTRVRWMLWKVREAALKLTFAIDVGPGRVKRLPVFFTPSIIATGMAPDASRDRL